MKHLVSIRDLQVQDALDILDEAAQMSLVNARAIKKLPSLRGRTIVNLFYENSTRTRVSFEIAATRLSADVINIAAETSSVTKGESLMDTVKTLEAIGADCIVIRHPESGAPQQLVTMSWTDCSVINAGDGVHEHPTQALLDAFTMQQSFGSNLTSLRVLIVGDIKHSRVARSNVLLLKLLGAEVELAGPSQLLPREFESLGVSISEDFDSSLVKKPDVVMMLRVQKERMLEAFNRDEAEYVSAWSLSSSRLGKIGKDSIVMHPGPINRGLEISSEAADDSRSKILQQAKNGVAIRMAVLRRALAGDT